MTDEEVKQLVGPEATLQDFLEGRLCACETLISQLLVMLFATCDADTRERLFHDLGGGMERYLKHLSAKKQIIANEVHERIRKAALQAIKDAEADHP